MSLTVKISLCMALLAAFCVLAPCLPPTRGDEPELPSGLEPESQVQEEAGPELPAGLKDEDTGGEPSLPPGLNGDDEDEPELPSGLMQEDAGDDEGDESEDRIPLRERLPFRFSGFWEARYGTRLRSDPYQQDTTLGETRLQLDLEKYMGGTRLKLVSDFLYDSVSGSHDPNLTEGRGWIDLRQANVTFSPASFLDVRAGRQILTWGTGNLLFLNDLFPKDWNSFFIGRDITYLKAPSDAIKASVFSEPVNMDVVYTPRFNADRYIDGRRISYWNSNLQRRAGRDAVVRPDRPDDWIDNDEWAMRLYKNAGGYELATYGYRGYWKSPAGYDPVAQKATFPPLSVYGASARGTVLGGIGNLEVAYYDSRDDRSGGDSMTPNSELRFLAGYEWEPASDLTVGVQYYLEHMMDYGEYRDALATGSASRDENRHVLTLDIRQLLMNQNLELSLFTFYSPSDEDIYLRPKVSYKIDDHWSVEAGGNIFDGEDRYTFFNQFHNNTNAYIALRYGF